MDLRLNGTTVVATGAGKGIGLATVRAFVRERARVVAGSRSATPAPSELAVTASVVTNRFTRPDEVAVLAVAPPIGRWPNLTGSSVAIDGDLVTTL